MDSGVPAALAVRFAVPLAVPPLLPLLLPLLPYATANSSATTVDAKSLCSSPEPSLVLRAVLSFLPLTLPLPLVTHATVYLC